MSYLQAVVIFLYFFFEIKKFQRLKQKKAITWIIHKLIYAAQRMKLYLYTANALQQSRSACPKGKIRQR